MYLQQIFLLGRATKDAEVSESKGGKPYAKFSLAVNEYIGSKDKEKQEKTYFYNVLVFNKSLERADMIKKGDLVMVDGRPDVDPYISGEGEAKASMVIYAKRWKLIK
jgi:single-strand DNA-binding protein